MDSTNTSKPSRDPTLRCVQTVKNQKKRLSTLRTMRSHSPPQRKHLQAQSLHDLKGYVQETFPLYHHHVHQTHQPLNFSDPDNLDQLGFTSCYLCSGHQAFPVSPSLSSSHLAAPRAPRLSPPTCHYRGRQSFLVAISILS